MNQKNSIRRATAAAALFCLVAVSQAQAQPIHIVALGASNTYGKGVLPSESYPAQLQALLREKGADVIVDNAGINGNTTGDMLTRLTNAVPADTQLVILQPGGNDQRQGLVTERSDNIDKICAQLAARGVHVIMMENGMLQSMPRNERALDGIHFTPKGYSILAERILPEVQAELGQKFQTASKN